MKLFLLELRNGAVERLDRRGRSARSTLLLSKVAILGLALSLCAGCVETVHLAPPSVPFGGRAVAISVALANPHRIVVASETGGLFRTFDGGQSWQHLDNLPTFAFNDVAIGSLNSDLIIATANAEYLGVNDGGIWRSLDGGASWTQPPTGIPAPGPNCTDRPNAYGISHMPLTHTFHVGTDCGLAISIDDGATWSHIVLDPSSRAGPLAHRVRSVVVVGQTGVATADEGVFSLGPNGQWTRVQDPDPSSHPVHGLTAPWWTGSPIFFMTTGSEFPNVWVSADAGMTWSQIPTPREDNSGRDPFVRVGRSLAGTDNQLELYYGAGMGLLRQTFSLPGPSGSGTWVGITSDHGDPNDIAFDQEFRIPVLLASDGGVHTSADNGASWTMTGGGPGGFEALQIAEVTGQVSNGPPTQTLYYSTQDNGIWGSPDGGASWTGSMCCEGRYLSLSAQSTAGPTQVTGEDFGGLSRHFLADPVLANLRPWPDAPAGTTSNAAAAPFQIVGEAYLQNVASESMPPSFDFYLTLSSGQAWSPSFSLPQPPVGRVLVTGSPANPTLFQGIRQPGSIPNGGSQFGLVRISNLAGAPTVVAADADGAIALGSLHTPIARYVVFGVDPSNPDHLVAPDVQANEMKYSPDGGAQWYSLPQLTSLVTGNGAYLFTIGDQSLASVVAWDPYDTCHILVGTIQNGILRSTDGGNSWELIDGSRQVTYVSSFYFPPTGTVWVSTNGRGLWTLDLPRTGAPHRCSFPSAPAGVNPLSGVVVIDPSTGAQSAFAGPSDPAVCPACTLVLVRNGVITSVESDGKQLTRIGISGGTIAQIDRSGRELPLMVANVYRPGDGRRLGREVPIAVAAPRFVRGLVLEGAHLRGLIASATELKFAPTRQMRVYAYSTERRRAEFALDSGQQVRIIGTGLLPGEGEQRGARILFDDRVVARGVPVNADGTFKIELPVARRPGETTVTVEQTDDLRLTAARTSIEVFGTEAETGVPTSTRGAPRH